MRSIKVGDWLNNFFSLGIISSIVFYFMKVAFWPLTYLFIISYAFTIILFLICFDWKFRLLGFIRDFLSPLILVGIIILVFLIDGHISNVVTSKDIFLILVLFSLFFLLYWNNKILKKKIDKTFTLNLIIISIAVISVLNLLNQLNISILPSGLLHQFNISGESTIANDYNFFSLFILYGLLILNYRSNHISFYNFYPKWFTYSLNFIFVSNILLSGSRRAIIIFVLLLSISLTISIVLELKDFSFKKLFKKSIIFFIILFIFIVVGVFIYQKIPRQKVSNVVYRYATLAGVTNFNTIEKFLWERESGIPIDRKYLIDKHSFTPDHEFWSGYSATGTILTNFETPYGTGIKVSREKGDNENFSLRYDGPKIIYYADHTYKISFKIRFIKGDFNSFNVGWWVNDGGRGFNSFSLDKEIETIENGWYVCTSKYKFIDNHIGLTGFINSVVDQTSLVISDFELIDLDYAPTLPRYVYEYNGKEELNLWLNKLDSPAKDLNLINNGDFSLGLAFWKHSSDSLSIKITNIDGNKCALINRGNGNGIDWSLYYVGRDIEFKANNQYQIAFKMKPVSSNAIPFNVGFWVDEGDGYQIGLKLKIDTLENGWLGIKAKYTFKNNQKNLMFPINSQIDNSSFYISDISIINLTQPQYQNIQVRELTDNKKKESRFSDRTARWSYAVELWETDYKWYNKLFGHGYKYLELYGKKFLLDPKQSDYPHNPFISVLLYSGIIGFIAYLWLLWKVITLYIIYRKDYAIAFIGFLITFFFSFFSGSSPFDPPIMGFFIMLPFFIHSIHKNENKPVYKKLSNDKDFNHREK